MRVSVVMATYNGENYLRQQLESILEQSELPDELVVSDDGSSDKTLSILRDFEKTAPFVTRLLVREKPLGFASNFANACLCATGDVIIFCDQDDSWRPDKVAAIKGYFHDHPEKELVLHDIAVCDADLRPIVGSYFSYLRSESHDPSYLVKGCATAITQSLRDRAYPLPIGGRWTHDCRVHAMAQFSETRGMLARILSDYRVHSSNTSGYVLPKNNWKGSIGAYLKKKSLAKSSLAYTTIQYFSLNDISDFELEEFYLASSSHSEEMPFISSRLKGANDSLNKRSRIARSGSFHHKVLRYLKLAFTAGYVDAGGFYSLCSDIMNLFRRRK